jgi:bifunctional non-homologous end joining protein LigD
MDDVLKSWAVPKGLPETSGVRRLALQVEDHPLDYVNFQGKIPEGEYGAGTVEIWDQGDYELLERSQDELRVRLAGKRFQGEYVLIHTRENQWILLKRKQEGRPA